MIPEFRHDGYLPEGIHIATEAEVTFRFGAATARRRRLVLRLRHWLELSRLTDARRFLVGGGYAVITNVVEYEMAERELRDLERRLERLQASHPIGSKGFTKAGIRKMIARIHEELAVYEGSEEARTPE